MDSKSEVKSSFGNRKHHNQTAFDSDQKAGESVLTPQKMKVETEPAPTGIITDDTDEAPAPVDHAKNPDSKQYTTELSFFQSETHSGDSVIVGLKDPSLGSQGNFSSAFSSAEPSPFQTLFTDMQKKRREETGFKKIRTSIEMYWQLFIDGSAPHIYARWIITTFLFAAYILRVYLTGGWYIITYALSIFLLNLFIGFLTPQMDPEMEGPGLPTKNDDEFRPFIRRLPEFKFWYSTSRAVALALFCTFFRVLDVPVFWPILVAYFLILFGLTMRQQISNMIKYKYLPWSSGKKTYSSSAPGPGKAK